ncbi:MAG: DNA-binding protein [Nanoarchaeota archaeon]
MEIKDIRANQGNVDIVAKIVAKEEPRTFEKFGKSGKVCNAKVEDGSGEIMLTLWNEEIDKVKMGDKIHLINGWCSEFRGEKRISTGKFGKIEVIDNTVYTNDPTMLRSSAEAEENADEEEPIEEEDFIE